MGDDTALIEGLLDKLGAAQAEAEQLRASLAALQTRVLAERTLADELAEALRRRSNRVALPDGSTGKDGGAERGQAEATLARWADARRR